MGTQAVPERSPDRGRANRTCGCGARAGGQRPARPCEPQSHPRGPAAALERVRDTEPWSLGSRQVRQGVESIPQPGSLRTTRGASERLHVLSSRGSRRPGCEAPKFWRGVHGPTAGQAADSALRIWAPSRARSAKLNLREAVCKGVIAPVLTAFLWTRSVLVFQHSRFKPACVTAPSSPRNKSSIEWSLTEKSYAPTPLVRPLRPRSPPENRAAALRCQKIRLRCPLWASRPAWPLRLLCGLQTHPALLHHSAVPGADPPAPGSRHRFRPAQVPPVGTGERGERPP